MRAITFLFLMLLTSQLKAQNSGIILPGKSDKCISVLNVGTFHMGTTNDTYSTTFDEYNPGNVEQVHQLARMLSAFKPTVIVVEFPPEYNSGLQKEYNKYLADPGMKFKDPSEIELLAYEVGRLSGTTTIYGIDYREKYGWDISEDVENCGDSAVFYDYMKSVEAYLSVGYEEKAPLQEVFRWINSPDYMDFMITINADILTHIASPEKSEGADEAAKYYHRNLVMYSNLNQIPLTEEDRVFILMGSSHTAFFNDFMRRSPKYKLVNVLDYLKE